MSGECSFSPLAIIFKENRLIGPNYMVWKRNLNIVLTIEEYKYVMINSCPEGKIPLRKSMRLRRCGKKLMK
jgi:hypothetical protein